MSKIGFIEITRPCPKCGSTDVRARRVETTMPDHPHHASACNGCGHEETFAELTAVTAAEAWNRKGS